MKEQHSTTLTHSPVSSIQSADVIVIGGGMAGISVASRLAEDLKVVVLEAEKQIGHHSTSRSAAMLIRGYGSAVLRQLNDHSYDLYNELDQLMGQSLLNIRGDLMVADESEKQIIENHLSENSGLKQIEVDQAVQLCPALRKEKIHFAAIEEDAADIDVDLLLQYYARGLRSQSGEIVTDTRVGDVCYENNSWQINTNNGRFCAPVVVNAAGAWADEIAKTANIAPLGLTPLKRSVALIKVHEHDEIDHWPLVLSASESWYAKPQSGLLIVSPADEEPVEPHDAWPEDIVLAEGLFRFAEFMNIDVKRIEHSWAGLRTFARDRNPVVGFSEQQAGFFWLAAQGGYGIQTAPILAQVGADLILGKKPQISKNVIDALSPQRTFKSQLQF